MPGRFPEGFRSVAPASLIDLAPTLCEIGHAPAPPDVQGRSLVSVLGGQEGDTDRSVFSELFTDIGVWKTRGPSGGPGRMLRKGSWKCMYYHGEEPELYNLAEDPGETSDRSRDPECKPILDRMLAEILSDWDPAELQADMDRSIAKRAFVRAAPADRSILQKEHWKGPVGYGWVDPV